MKVRVTSTFVEVVVVIVVLYVTKGNDDESLYAIFFQVVQFHKKVKRKIIHIIIYE